METSARTHYKHRGQYFDIVRTSSHSAVVQLICDEHGEAHADFLVKLIGESDFEWVTSKTDTNGWDWAVGRASQGYPIKGSFKDAVSHAADLLSKECSALKDIANLFGNDKGLIITEKALSYMGRRYVATMDSSVSVRIDIVCDRHEHQRCVIGLALQAEGWGVVRPDTGMPKFIIVNNTLQKAVDQANNLLFRECQSMDDLNCFFE